MKQSGVSHSQDAGALPIRAPFAAVLAEAEASLPDLIVQLHVDERAECYKVDDVGVINCLLKIASGDTAVLAFLHFAFDQLVHFVLLRDFNCQAQQE